MHYLLILSLKLYRKTEKIEMKVKSRYNEQQKKKVNIFHTIWRHIKLTGLIPEMMTSVPWPHYLIKVKE